MLLNDLSSRYQRVHYVAETARRSSNCTVEISQATDIVLCSITVYELRYGAQRSVDPTREHSKLDLFLSPFTSLPFDDLCARRCGELRAELEAAGNIIGPHDLQIAAIALQHGLTLVTHNSREFRRIAGLKLDDWEA